MRRALGLIAILSLACLSGCRSSTPNSQTAQQPAGPAAAPSSSSPNAASSAAGAPATDASGSAQPGAAAAPPPAPPPPIVVPAGTTITVRTGQALGSKTSQTGQSFTATLVNPVSVGGSVAIPASSPASGTVVSAKAKGKVKGEGELDLALTGISIQGKSYVIATNTLEQTIKGKGKRTAKATGGGAAAGAIIGGIAGGGKGAAIGAGVGAGAGFVAGTATGNQQIELPAETVLSFKLSQSLTVSPQ
jgi:hypothetical protein